MSEDETPDELPEDLPEQYVLTPEDVEDEAVRGDFVIRWAVILLGVLLGCTALVESEPLAGVASGRWYAGHGWWPRVEDPFSFTAAGRAWANPHWLFDLFRAGVVAAGGWTLLTVWTAAKAGGLAWTAGRCGVDGVSTWWGSVTLSLMLLACAPVLIPTPDLITPVCVAAALWADKLAQSKAKWRWAWVPLLIAQTNMDAHAWVTAVVVVALGVRAEAWGPTAAAVACLLANPFPLETLARPLEQHRYHYPELFAYGSEEPFGAYLLRPAWMPEFWSGLSLPAVAALVLCVVSLVLVLLDRERRGGSLIVWAAATAMAMLCGHQWPAASVVFAVLAGAAGQRWYAGKFSQEYTTDWKELAWSRGGRGLTVLALFLLAGLMLTGRLGLADGRRVGLGLSEELATRAASAGKLIEATTAERPLHFRLEQGDGLALAGGRTAVDHRVGLFAPALTRRHRAARAAAVAGDVQETEDFDAAVPRLYGEAPDYGSLIRLLAGGWRLETLQAAGAVLRPPGTDVADPFPAASLTTLAPAPRPTWPLPPTGYDRFFNTPPPVSEGLLLSAHHGRLVGVMTVAPQSRATMIRAATRGVQAGNVGLSEDMDAPLGWRGLADCYRALRLAEADARESGTQDLRVTQELSALWQWSRCEPDNPVPHARLFETFAAFGRKDSAVRSGEEALRLDPEAAVDADRLAQLREDVAAVRADVEAMAEAGVVDRGAVAIVRGCPRLTIQIMEADLTRLAGNEEAVLLLSGAYVRAAEFEQADAFLTDAARRRPSETTGFLQYQVALSRADYAAARLLIDNYRATLPPGGQTKIDAARMLLEVESGDTQAAADLAASLAGSTDEAVARLAAVYATVLGAEPAGG